jgi:hypothetical protein
MKIIEIIGGLRVPLNNEEVDLSNKVKKQTVKEVSDLNDREKQVLLLLVHKNVVNIDGNKITFNGLQHPDEAIW